MASEAEKNTAREARQVFYDTMIWYSRDEIKLEDLQNNFYHILKQLPKQFFLDPELQSILNDKSPYGESAYAVFTMSMYQAKSCLLRERQSNG